MQANAETPSHRDVLQFAKHVRALASQRAPGKHLTELRVAEWLVRDHGMDLRHTKAFGWMVWADGVWKQDITGEVFRRGKRTVRSLYAEAEGVEDDTVRKAIIDFARSCESSAKIKAIIEHAKTEPGIAIDAGVFDADQMVLNCRNGVIDLRTGELRAHSRDDYCMKQAGCDFDPDMLCPAYEIFINGIFASNPDMVPFSDRKFGYTLTGLATEQQFDIWHGDGDNGKSKLTELAFEIMGDYAVRAPSKLLMVKRNDGHATDRMIFRGARFVSSAESGESVKLDEDFIKSMTGTDRVTARLCHCDNVSFPPTWKLQMFTNHRPRIAGTDHGIWRRVHLWPFSERFPDPIDPENPQPGEKDKNILDKLRPEHPGILARWVRGGLEWKKKGLAPPKCVVDATEQYREESDVFGQFIIDCCDVYPAYEVQGGDLYAVYRLHAKENGYCALSSVNFSKRMAQRPGVDHHKGRTRKYTGLKINDEWRNKLDFGGTQGESQDARSSQYDIEPS